MFTDTKSVNGNGDYPSSIFTPEQAGTYRWIAGYSGDLNNNAAAGACNDPNESFTVAPTQRRSLTVATEGSGSGFVDSAPAGIDCGRNAAGHDDCARDFAEGTSVTLIANPSADTNFAGFTGDCSDDDFSCTTTMDQARSVTATFVLESSDPLPIAPALIVDLDATQELGPTVALTASCNQPCSVVATAKLKTVVERNGKRNRGSYTVRKAGAKLDSAGEVAGLELTLTRKARRRARRALDSGGSAEVKGVVTATDEALSVIRQRFEIELT